MIDDYWTFKIFGYHSDDLKPHSGKYVVVVCDECGLYNSQPMSRYTCTSGLCKSCVMIGERNPSSGKRTPKQKATLSKNALTPKDPLPDGWQSKLSDITDNKECAVYLGSIAEIILSNIYNDVRVMPYGNHGFDVICNRDFKIDIKAAATGYKGYWQFRINKNPIADLFLCIAFESRDDLHTPAHLWMIPGHIINHLQGLTIREATIDKWSKYSLSLDKLIACCDTIR